MDVFWEADVDGYREGYSILYLITYISIPLHNVLLSTVSHLMIILYVLLILCFYYVILNTL